MPSIDARSQQYANEFTEKVIEVFQENLISVLLYGSAAGNYFEPGESDVNILVVLKSIDFGKMNDLSSATKKYKLGGVEPLFLTLAEFREIPEHFPLEAVNILDDHQILYGEDLGQQLKVSRQDIHAQLVRELFAKTLRCRCLVQEHGDDKKKCLEVLNQIVAPYKVMMRAILRLVDDQFAPPTEFLELVTQIEERHGILLEGFREVYQVRAGTKKLFGNEHKTLLERIAMESASLAQFASGMLNPRI